MINYVKEYNNSFFVINPNSENFRWFLVWLVDEKDFTAHEIVDVVYESHKYQELEKEYLKWEKKC
tara:strand:+ start:694 stop:888 length:195 start_codon:yes stop_codon:yes gene_type:complete